MRQPKLTSARTASLETQSRAGMALVLCCAPSGQRWRAQGQQIAHSGAGAARIRPVRPSRRCEAATMEAVFEQAGAAEMPAGDEEGPGFIVRQAENTDELRVRTASSLQPSATDLYCEHRQHAPCSPVTDDACRVLLHARIFTVRPLCVLQAAAELRAEAFYDDLQARCVRTTYLRHWDHDDRATEQATPHPFALAGPSEAPVPEAVSSNLQPGVCCQRIDIA